MKIEIHTTNSINQLIEEKLIMPKKEIIRLRERVRELERKNEDLRFEKNHEKN